MVEEEASKRIEMLVKKRVEEELERRRSEIELEVSRRVEEAKAKMEQELILELEKRREAAREEERKREVGYRPGGGMRRQTDRYTPRHRLYVPVRCSVSLSLFPSPVTPSPILILGTNHISQHSQLQLTYTLIAIE